MTDPNAEGMVTIRYEHFLWLNKETLRLSAGWRDLAAEKQALLAAGDALDAYCKRVDGTTNGILPVRQAWADAKAKKGIGNLSGLNP